MPTWLLSKWVVMAIVAGMIGLAGFSAGWKLNDNRWQAKWSAHRLEDQEAMTRAQEEVRKIESALQVQVDEARQAHDKALSDIRQRDAQIARLRVDRDRLRDDLTAFAAASPAADTVAACRDRAARLADLLAEGAGIVLDGTELARQAALAADERAAKLKACVEGWPK